jgi:NADH-quinone oxidoreductase subunit M
MVGPIGFIVGLSMILSALIWGPIIAGLIALVLRPVFAKSLALFVSVGSVAFMLFLCRHFQADAGFQWIEWLPWFFDGELSYAVGVDGISLILLLLNVLLMPCIVLMVKEKDYSHYSRYMGALLILAGLVNGSFLALDSILFYVFFEALLIPMFLLIGIWGGEARKAATLKFFLFTLFGSVFLLIALLYLHNACADQGLPQSFSILSFQELPLLFQEQCWLFLAMTLAFAIKIPMWPVHTWLPQAHVEAPTEGSVLLAALLLKMGAYGLLRFVLPIVPDAAHYYAPVMIGLSLITIVYIGWVAIIQENMKKLIAYSSIAHMAFVVLGIFLLFPLIDQGASLDTLFLSVTGSYLQMIAHGLSSAALFFSVGILYKRVHSKMIKDYRGIAHAMPVFATLFMVFALSNIGLPGTGGFVGEFFVLMASFSVSPWIAIIAASTLVWSACYSLWLYKRVFFGPLSKGLKEQVWDLDGAEKTVCVFLALLIIAFGLYPRWIISRVEPSLLSVIEHVRVPKGF